MSMIKEVIRGLKKMIIERIEKATTNLFIKVQVKEVYETDGRLYIRANSLHNDEELFDVKLLSHGLGHARGIIAYPKPKDFGVIINILGEQFYIGSTHDDFTKFPDTQIPLSKDSMFLINNSFGSYICLHENNDIILKSKNGSKIKLGNDGSLKLFNKDNFGLDIDKDGNVLLRGANASGSSSSAYETSSPGTWDNLS